MATAFSGIGCLSSHGERELLLASAFREFNDDCTAFTLFVVEIFADVTQRRGFLLGRLQV